MLNLKLSDCIGESGNPPAPKEFQFRGEHWIRVDCLRPVHNCTPEPEPEPEHDYRSTHGYCRDSLFMQEIVTYRASVFELKYGRGALLFLLIREWANGWAFLREGKNGFASLYVYTLPKVDISALMNWVNGKKSFGELDCLR